MNEVYKASIDKAVERCWEICPHPISLEDCLAVAFMVAKETKADSEAIFNAWNAAYFEMRQQLRGL